MYENFCYWLQTQTTVLVDFKINIFALLFIILRTMWKLLCCILALNISVEKVWKPEANLIIFLIFICKGHDISARMVQKILYLWSSVASFAHASFSVDSVFVKCCVLFQSTDFVFLLLRKMFSYLMNFLYCFYNFHFFCPLKNRIILMYSTFSVTYSTFFFYKFNFFTCSPCIQNARLGLTSF